MRKLSKRSVLKKKKQQLIDRINNNKSLKELKGWERTFSYYDVLKDDFDWDYEFLLDLIEFKLKRMSNYFHTHRIVENEDWYGTLCDKAIAILHAGYKTDIVLSKDLNGIYVNTRNKNRFIPGYMKRIIHSQEYLDKYELALIREEKAKALFWKFLHHYIEILWD
jgi:hypothetical protein